MTWPDSITDFDRARWWRYIACSNRGRHELAVVGILYTAKAGDTYWSPRTEQVENGWKVSMSGTRLDDESKAAVRAAGHEGSVTYGLGSLEVRCEHGCTIRLPRDRWNALQTGILDAATRGEEPAWVDVSVYV